MVAAHVMLYSLVIVDQLEELAISFHGSNLHFIPRQFSMAFVRGYTLSAITDKPSVEPARRQWRHWNFVSFWIADSFNVNTCVGTLPRSDLGMVDLLPTLFFVHF